MSGGLHFRSVHGIDDARTMVQVLDAVWGGWDGAAGIQDATILALAHAGNYAEVALVGDEPVGAALGFFGEPLGEVLHSHIVGVLPRARGLGIGKAIKMRQRDWCRQRTITTMTWTFDPLVARNAYFNIEKLGARPTLYLIDYYGQMSDGINAGQASDRVLLTWDLTIDTPPPPRRGSLGRTFAALTTNPGGRPELHSAPPECAHLTLEVPTDIERLRRDDAPLSHEWRIALRRTLPELLDAGWRVTNFDRAGLYNMERS
jgi:predicted GNAT superfamily acetyltransferase